VHQTGGAFTAENGAAQLGLAFHEVTCIRASQVSPVVIEDATVAADYVNSLASHYQAQAARPWHEVVSDVQEQVQAAINANGNFRTVGDVAAFVCR
jgi:hypothetical protein